MVLAALSLDLNRFTSPGSLFISAALARSTCALRLSSSVGRIPSSWPPFPSPPTALWVRNIWADSDDSSPTRASFRIFIRR